MSTASGNTTNPASVIADLNTKIKYLHAQLEEMKLKTLAAAPEPEKKTMMPKFPKPNTFNGTKGDVRTFLTQAKAYLKVNDSINKESIKILYIRNLLTGKAIE
ncbi:hypothetical protein G3M48_000207 [Beauveria asiatica]|uniref:Uncharacterized protein n=1 Tax=Beauveria asiatica TaxID=1069075 RepID=A0AAW0RHE2_9HYPO